ncbi:unnamed protein product [Cylicocyclus nassatus]|uniref:Uncharacterized protein n=1 Tax=Cylicocyclus nassatus TaxID=53992 RepID=A0AA36GX47_CYLNA|nr:unnamed protein product [Cylicocyclus nassatus]
MFMCIGAFLASTFIHGLLGFPPLQGFAMIGGALWGIGNAFTLQIMNRLGMALTVLVCSTVSCLTGWATSRYGLLGLPAAVPASIAMNYLGIILLVIGGVMYLFIKNNEQGNIRVAENSATNDGNGKLEISISRVERALSFLAAVLCGSFIGSMWTPISYIRSHPEEFPKAPADSISYQFSFYCGGICVGVCVFIIYSLIMRNRPWFNPSGAVPTMIGGIIFAIGMSFFVIAIDNLDQAIAYPICAMAPNLVVLSWSILYFKEITGRRNLIFLASAYGLTLTGVILIAISKEFSFA